MRFRKLRIAWSVTWGVVALMLVTLWVRSYWRLDDVSATAHPLRLSFRSALGVARFYFEDGDDVSGPFLDFATLEIDPMLADGIRWQDRELNLGFGFDIETPVGQLSCPYWFLLLTITSTATASWLPLKRFNLRTLLIATTLVAVVLGLIVWAAHHRQGVTAQIPGGWGT